MDEVNRGGLRAVVAVVRRAGRVLVIRRGPSVLMPGYWAPVSGRIEPDEREEEAVVRETFEEVGLRVTPVAKAWECDTHDGAFRLHWWIADASDGELALDPAEIAEGRWIDPGDFSRLEPTFEDDRRFFEEILPGFSEPS